MPDNVVDNLRVQVEAEAKKASAAIEGLEQQLNTLKSAVSGLKGVKVGSLVTPSTIENLKAFSEVLNGINTKKLGDLATASAGFRDYSGAIGDLSSKLTNISSKLGKLVPEQDKVAKSTKSATKEMSRQSREAHNSHKAFSLASTAVGRFVSSVKRIAYYRFIRAVLKSFTTGLKEGIDNMYQWSAAVGSSFAPSMDKMATATQYLKNGFASMWSPLIEYAIPILDRVIDKLVDFFNFAQEGFAKLTGADHWTKALKVPKQYADVAADSAAGATKAAKELQNVLMGFDELNVINTPSDNGGGGSGSSGKEAEDYSSMFQLMQTQTSGLTGELAKWAERFKGLIETFAPAFAPLKTAFESTKETLKALVDDTGEWIDNTNFQPLADSVENLNTQVADLVVEINTDLEDAYRTVVLPIATWLVESELPDTINNIAGAITVVKDAIHDLYAMFKEFWDNTEDARTQIKEFFGNRHEEIDELFGKISEWLEENEPTFQRIGDVVGRVVNSLAKLFGPLFDLIAKVGFEVFMQNLMLLLATLTPVLEALATVLDLLNTALEPLTDTVGKGFGITGKILTGDFVGAYEDFKGVAEDFASGKFFDDWGQSWKDFGERTSEAWSGWWDGLKTKTEEGAATVVQKIQGKIDELKNNKSFQEWRDNTGQAFDEFFTNVSNSTTEWWNNTKEWWNNNVAKKVLEFATVKYPEIKQKVSEKWSEFKGWWASQWETVKLNCTNILTIVLEKWNQFKDWWKTKIETVKLTCMSILDLVKQKWEQFKAWWAGRYESVKINVPNLVELFRKPWENLKNWWSGLSLNAFHIKLPHFYSYDDGGILPKIGVQWYATGGFPDPGSFFWAGENGVPEILGTVNGRTAVAGGQEITGIADAIYAQGAREEQLLQTLISVLQAKDFSFTPNAASGKAINQALRQYAGVTG